MSSPLLQVAGLTKLFVRAGRNFAAVDGVSFDLAPGETLALAGPSGSGKSTVARLVMQLTRADTGTVCFNGHDLGQLPADAWRPLRRHFQMVFQDSNSAFNPRATVASALDDPLRIHGMADAATRPQIIGELLAKVGLDAGLARRAIHEISGGQRQRVAVARALATNPSLIVLDEALSAIDSSVRRDMVKLLLDLQATHNTAYLFISHDLALVRAVAHRIAIMDAGKIAEIGGAQAIIDAPRSPIGQALVAAVPRLNRDKMETR